jgi:hypothetical protein
MTFYGNRLKICKDFTPNFGEKGTGFFITTMHSHTFPSSQRNFFTKNNMTIVPTHPTFLFPRFEIKLKGHHFEIIEVIEAESQAALNTLTDHDLQDAF